MVAVQQMTILFILMMVGYLCRKRGYLTAEVENKLSAIIVNIANPAVLIAGCITKERLAPAELLNVFGIILLVFAALILLAQMLPEVLRIPKEEKGIYRAMTVFSNVGFMGIPMVKAMYGDEAMIYLVIVTIPFNVLIYTYGMIVMTGESHLSGKKILKYLMNIGVGASLLAIGIYITGYMPPVIITSSLNYLGNLVAPLSMMIVGASFADMKLQSLMKYKLILFSLIKIIVLPVIGVLILKPFVQDEKLLGVCMILLATPVGSMTAMLAKQSGMEAEAATEGIALTTILSIVTIPVVSLLVG